MKVLHWHLLKEIITVTLVTIGILTFVLVIGNIFTRLFDLLINNDIPFWFIVQFVAYLIPFSLVFTLPWGMLTAVLLVYGRMSADSELVAIRAGGISLTAFSAPVLLLSVVCSGLCLLINSYVAPLAHAQIKSVVYNLAAQSPTSLFENDSVIDQFPGKRIYVERKEGNTLHNLHVWDLENSIPVRSFRAGRGEIFPDEMNNAIILKLYDARMEERNPKDPHNLRLVETGRRFEELPLEIPLTKLLGDTEKGRGLGSLNIEDLIGELSITRENKISFNFTPMLTEIQKRVSSALSCVTFVLVGIPLAIRSHRRETSIGIIMSFGVVFAYYFLIIIAETFKSRPGAFPELIIWAPNLIFQVVGLFAFLRVARQ